MAMVQTVVIFENFNVFGICTSGNYAQKVITKLYRANY